MEVRGEDGENQHFEDDVPGLESPLGEPAEAGQEGDSRVSTAAKETAPPTRQAPNSTRSSLGAGGGGGLASPHGLPSQPFSSRTNSQRINPSLAIFTGEPISLQSHRSAAIAAASQVRLKTRARKLPHLSKFRKVSHTAKEEAEMRRQRASSPESAYGARVAIAPSSLLAGRGKDPHEWVLALRKAEEDVVDVSGLEVPKTSEDSFSCVEESSSRVPLEDRITLRQLKHIMKIFSSKGTALLTALWAQRQQEMLGETGKEDPSAAAPPEPSVAEAPPPSSSTSKGKRPPKGTSFLEKKRSIMQQQQQQQSANTTIHEGGEGGPPAEEGVGEDGQSPQITPRTQDTDEDEESMGLYEWASSHPRRSQRLSTVADLTEVLMERDEFGRPVKEESYNRQLSEEDFVLWVCHIIPTVTAEEVVELANKVDYEAHGRISWNELATFLVSRSRHRTFMRQANFEFVDSPDPSTCTPTNLHQTVTCYTIDETAKLILTGGSEGNVRGWSINTLAYRGLLFAVDGWIAGIHYGEAKNRVLFVITVNRQVFMLDATSFDVLRLYRGRAVDETHRSLVYAHDTLANVKVGGVGLNSRARGVARDPLDVVKQNQKERQKMKRDLLKDVSTAEAATMTTATAYATLNFDSTPLTGHGTGPYVERVLEEGALSGLVDCITYTLYHYTALDEEALLLSTTAGKVFIYVFALKPVKRVLVPHHVLTLHESRINKMELLLSMDALISAGDDGRVHLTSLVNGQTLRTFYAHVPEQHVSVRDFSINTKLKLLVTVGAERRGLVWDFTHENPMAILEAHNSPCRCCCCCVEQNRLITVGSDGVVFAFDTTSFNAVQKIELNYQHAPQWLTFDEGKQRLVGFGRYPFQLRTKRQVTSSCPAKYRGHNAVMLRCLYTETFDQVITVDCEGMTMTWNRDSGEHVFAFLMKDFSDSATMNAARLAATGLDGLQRRLLTGYANGAVVVWNVVNGQAINFITAGMADDELTGLAVVAGVANEAAAAESIERPWRIKKEPPHPDRPTPATPKKKNTATVTSRPTSRGKGTEPETSSAPSDPTTATTGSAALSREVTAVGSLVRHGVTFFLFAIGHSLYTVRESSNFTVASAACWTIPTNFGEVTAMTQVNPQMVACGSAIGALFFYHVLSECQEGAPLWANDTSEASMGPGLPAAMLGQSVTRRTLGLTGSLSRSRSMAPHVVTARINSMYVLQNISPQLLLCAHTDGTLALWHTVRRVFLGAVNLAAAGIDDGSESTGTVLVAVDARSRYLVFADEGGNIHVCTMTFTALSKESEAVALNMPNPALYCERINTPISTVPQTPAPHISHIVPVPEDVLPPVSPVVNDGERTKEPSEHRGSLQRGSISRVSGRGSIAAEPVVEPEAAIPPPMNAPPPQLSAYDQERVAYTFETFSRIRIFGSGMPTISSILVINSRDEGGEEGEEDAHSRFDDESVRENSTAADFAATSRSRGGSSAAASAERSSTGAGRRSIPPPRPRPYHGPLIVCTGVDNYTRAFTLDGMTVGELGMDGWTLTDPSTYHLMGDAGGRVLPPSLRINYGVDEGYDYLEEARLAQQQAVLLAANATVGRRMKSRSNRSAAASTADLFQTTRGMSGVLGYSITAPLPSYFQGNASICVTDNTSAAKMPLQPPTPAPTSTAPLDAALSLASTPAPTTGMVPLGEELAKAPAPEPRVIIPLRALLSSRRRWNTDPRLATAEEEGEKVPPLEHREPRAVVEPTIDTLFKNSSRQRYQEDGRYYRGIIKRHHANDLRRRLATENAHANFLQSTESGGEEDSQLVEEPFVAMGDLATDHDNTSNMVSVPDIGGAGSGRQYASPLSARPTTAAFCHSTVDVDAPDGAHFVSPPHSPINNSKGQSPGSPKEGSTARGKRGSLVGFPVELHEVGPARSHTQVSGQSSLSPVRTNPALSSIVTKVGGSRPHHTGLLDLPSASSGDCFCPNGTGPLQSSSARDRSNPFNVSITTAIPPAIPVNATGIRPGMRPTRRAHSPEHLLAEARDVVILDDGGGAEADAITNPHQLLNMHLDQRKQQLLDNSICRKTKEHLERTFDKGANVVTPVLTSSNSPAGAASDQLTPMSGYVAEVLQKARKRTIADTLSGPRSFIAQISARMQIAPVEETEAPLGSRSRDEAKLWREHLKRLQSKN